MYSKEHLKRLGAVNGVRFKNITLYAAELTILKSEGLTDQSIADLLSASANRSLSKDVVNKWFIRSTAPKDCFISVLEDMHLQRIETYLSGQL